jgi:hypothetical protein
MHNPAICGKTVVPAATKPAFMLRRIIFQEKLAATHKKGLTFGKIVL